MESSVICKYCQSERIRKYGKYKDTQYYYCNDCNRKFAGLDTIPKMQYSTSKIADVLSMYYEGMSLQEIRRNLIQQHGDYISDVTALNWVRRFSKQAIEEAGKYKPQVGSVWVADETVLDIDGKNIEESPNFGSNVNTDFILGMGKVGESVKILLDIDKVLVGDDLSGFAGRASVTEDASVTDDSKNSN